jgi:hypothetical protein
MINDPYNLDNMTITLGSGTNILGGTTNGTYTITQTNNTVPTYASPGYNWNTITQTNNTVPTYASPGYNWNTISTGTGTDTITIADWGNLSNTLQVNGDANFEGDIKIKGKSLVDSLEKIEEKLAILRPNEQLEEKWEELRNLRKQYMELEKEIIEKEKIWDILKK